MQFQKLGSEEQANIVKATTKTSQESANERRELGTALKSLPAGEYLKFQPATKDGKDESIRGMKLKISRSANEAGISDIQYGNHKDGALVVWRDASATKRTRKPKNGTVETPVATAKVAVPA